MEGILELLPSVLEGPSVHHLQNYLEACDEHVAFHGKDKKNEGYIKLVNVKLNENDTRLEGLLILRVALQQCSVEVFVDNASSWMSQCVKGSFDRNCKVVNTSLSVLGTLLKTAVKFPEIKKYAASNVVPSILEHSRREINVETIHSILECLLVCIQEYPGPCGESSRFIQNLLTKLLDAEPHSLLLAAKCYALLSQVKGKGKQGVSPQNIWKNNQLILVHTLHHYLDLLFSNVDEIQTSHRLSKGDLELLINKQINKNASPSERMQHIMKCIKGLSKFLKALLVGSFPVIKTVMPDVIIGLVCRGLAVTCHSLGNITTDALALGSVLPEIHADLMDVLIALIACCGRNLIQYGSIICKLLNQELKWTNTSEWPYALDKPFRNLRSTVYSCLHCWLSTARSASSIELVIEDIVLYILQDIRMDKNVVTLKAKGGTVKKNQPHYNFLSDTRSDKLGLKFANKGLVLSGLKCLQLILYSSSVHMKSTLCKAIQESIITLLFEVQQTHDGPPIPYSDGVCRKELYSTLLALCMEPHPTFPPPINYALAIFKRGVTDSFMELSVLCTTALSNLEKIIHPSAPPLGTTLQYDTLQQCSGETSNKDDSVLSVDINNTPPSIKDMPLSAFPNLNNVIVLKVYDNKSNFKESIDGNERICGLNSETELSGLSSNGTIQSCKTMTCIEKKVFHLNGSNAINQNCNLGDIMSMDNSFVSNDSVLNSQTENNLHTGNKKSGTECDFHNSSVKLEKPTEKSSLFEKINGIISDDIEEENFPSIRPINLNNKLEKSHEVLEENKCADVNLEVTLSDEPPLKKVKVLESENEEKTDNNVKTSELVVSVDHDKVNGETNSIHDEDEMMNCFVDTVQE